MFRQVDAFRKPYPKDLTLFSPQLYCLLLCAPLLKIYSLHSERVHRITLLPSHLLHKNNNTHLVLLAQIATPLCFLEMLFYPAFVKILAECSTVSSAIAGYLSGICPLCTSQLCTLLIQVQDTRYSPPSGVLLYSAKGHMYSVPLPSGYPGVAV